MKIAIKTKSGDGGIEYLGLQPYKVIRPSNEKIIRTTLEIEFPHKNILMPAQWRHGRMEQNSGYDFEAGYDLSNPAFEIAIRFEASKGFGDHNRKWFYFVPDKDAIYRRLTYVDKNGEGGKRPQSGLKKVRNKCLIHYITPHTFTPEMDVAIKEELLKAVSQP